MRGLLILTVMISAAAMLPAQTPPPPKKSAADIAAENRRLDMYLLTWEKKMGEVRSLSTVLNRRDTDKVFKTTTDYTGWAAYMKSGEAGKTMNKAILELKLKDKNEIAEKIICTGTYVYNFLPARKIIESHELPKGQLGELGDNASLGLMFGMKAEVAKRRFHLSLFQEDKDYIYIDVLPKEPSDKAEFTRARLILNKDTMLPRQVWLEQPNQNTTLWDMPRSGANVQLDPRIFDTPRPPEGWKLVPIIKQRDEKTGESNPPRVIRPASK
jgi:TIGR03009 family protein